MLGRRLIARLWPAATFLLAASCVAQPVTEQGQAAKGLYDSFTLVAAVIFIVVAGLIGFSIVAFRKKSDDETRSGDRRRARTHGRERPNGDRWSLATRPLPRLDKVLRIPRW